METESASEFAADADPHGRRLSLPEKAGLAARCHCQVQDPSGVGGEDDRTPAAAASSD